VGFLPCPISGKLCRKRVEAVHKFSIEKIVEGGLYGSSRKYFSSSTLFMPAFSFKPNVQGSSVRLLWPNVPQTSLHRAINSIEKQVLVVDCAVLFN